MATIVRTVDVIYRFGHYEFESGIPELRKFGRRIKVEQKPLIVLGALLERHGEVVSRAELRNRLWPDNTFVDFELGLNVAIRKLVARLATTPTSPNSFRPVLELATVL
jgi:DNA-binding winged helix-turn-helix (wHTH) protein